MNLKKNSAEYIRNIPKVELHMHIEGSFEPELIFAIAHRNRLEVQIDKAAPKNQEEKSAIKKLRDKVIPMGIVPKLNDDGGIKVIFNTPEQLKQVYDFDNLQEFLDIYYAGMNVLQTEQDFYDLTFAYLKRCHAQNIVHTEIFFDPQGHTSRGIAFVTVINGIYHALQAGKDQLGISSGLIMSYLRHLSEAEAIKTWQESQPYIDKFIGVGLDSSEMNHPPSKFSNVFAMARAANKKVVAHAGEEGPAEYVLQALDNLRVDRIDHGNRSLEDPKLVKRLVDERKVLTVCPLSNYKLQVVKNRQDHPLKRMLDMGLKATVNSDDPAYFGGYLNENFAAVQAALNLSINDIHTLVLNSIEGSFLPEDEKAKFCIEVNEYHRKFVTTQG